MEDRKIQELHAECACGYCGANPSLDTAMDAGVSGAAGYSDATSLLGGREW